MVMCAIGPNGRVTPQRAELNIWENMGYLAPRGAGFSKHILIIAEVMR